MTRRSTPQKRIDDEAFPVRVKLLVPEGGFERQFDDLYRWLNREAGRGDYALHSASSLGITRDAAVYFRTPETAHRFVRTSPTCCWPTAPTLWSTPRRTCRTAGPRTRGSPCATSIQ